MTILIIEDDPYICLGLKEALQNNNTIIKTAYNLQEARLNYGMDIDLIILDIHLPDGLGTEFINEIRLQSNTPILCLSAINEEETIVEALNNGADDYVTKPFSINVLTSRIKSILRRNHFNDQLYSYENISINDKSRIVKIDNEVIDLTPIEYTLLLTFTKANGKVLTRRLLIETIWDLNNKYIEDNTLSVSIKRLKNKIGNDKIETIRGVGYRLVNHYEK